MSESELLALLTELEGLCQRYVVVENGVVHVPVKQFKTLIREMWARIEREGKLEKALKEIRSTLGTSQKGYIAICDRALLRDKEGAK